MSDFNVVTINTQRRSVAFFVQKLQYMKRKDGEKFVQAVKGEIPDSWKFTRNGEKRTNAPWHADKNGKFVDIAFEHVFNGEPIPSADGQAIALKEKKQELEQKRALLKEAEMDEELEAVNARLEEYRKKRKAEIKEKEKDGELQSVDKRGTAKVSGHRKVSDGKKKS